MNDARARLAENLRIAEFEVGEIALADATAPPKGVRWLLARAALRNQCKRQTISQGMISNLTPLAAAILLGLVFARPADAVDALEPQALKALFPGTFYAVVHGQDVTFDAHGDGSLVARSGENKDTGQWSIRQEKLCVMLPFWLQGRTMCARVFPDGGWYRVEHIVFRQQ